MSLDISLTVLDFVEVYDTNITHNLGKMAKEAGIYDMLWRPEETGISFACQLIKPLVNAIDEMKKDPKRFSKHNSPNAWGVYQDFVPWLEDLLAACMENPEAQIRVSV